MKNIVFATTLHLHCIWTIFHSVLICSAPVSSHSPCCIVLHSFIYKGVPKLTQDLNLIENTVFSLDYVIFLLNYKVHRIGLFVEQHIMQMSFTALHAHTHSCVEIFHDYFA